MYIRTQEEALSAVAEILDLSQRRDQIVQSTVKIMLCLEAEPRTFMSDCQALLVEGGLEELQRRRRDLMDSIENAPLVVLDPEEDRLFEATARAMDALRFSGVFFKVFPGFAGIHEGWVVARAILADEETLKRDLSAAIRARRYAEEFDPARLSIEAMIIARRPDWIREVPRLRDACRRALRRAGEVPTERLDEEGDAVFEVLATSDERARQVLGLMESDPSAADVKIRQAHGLLEAVRSVLAQSPPSQDEPGVSRVA